MKKNLLIILIIFTQPCLSQEVLHLNNGSIITVQAGASMNLQGGITLDNGSLLINNGITSLKNNSLANQSNWKDNSVIGALGGTGLVIFNSDLTHQYLGPTHFYNVQINTGSLALNNHFNVENQLYLVKGRITTGINQVVLSNNAASSLLNDVSNVGYVNSWINGNFRRLITNNASTYDFPVGSAVRCNLLQFLNNNISGTNYITTSFGPKPGTDAGLNVVENMAAYASVNNGGVWYLTPDASPSSGKYGLQLYFTGFAGLANNMFGILRRPDASINAADWIVPTGSLLESTNGWGRKVSDGFARRYNISSFSQWGIGIMGNIPCVNCTTACTYTQGFYGNKNGLACYNNSGNTITSTKLMLNAFGALTQKVFGNISTRRFFTLYKTDISNGNIFKMLPGSGNSQALAVDDALPYDGAYYSDQSTWYLVPIATNGNQKGKINNQLLSQLISLWFNLQTSNTLGAIDLSNDTLVTTKQTFCGSGILTGSPEKFGLPHNVVVYLNGGNGYTSNISGLFQLANDILGGANNSVNPLEAQYAVTAVNNAFDGCRVLTGTLPYLQPITFITKNSEANKLTDETVTEKLIVTAFPNPYDKEFSLSIVAPVTGKAMIEFFDLKGEKIYQAEKFLIANAISILPYKGPIIRTSVFYNVHVGAYQKSGVVVHPN
ncbi:MAG TPA: hypothetical protein VFU29_12825 [Chitinophagaceae bacterium]|nr:hypothetical protein [Chitinophagaceae bacterium]